MFRRRKALNCEMKISVNLLVFYPHFVIEQVLGNEAWLRKASFFISYVVSIILTMLTVLIAVVYYDGKTYRPGKFQQYRTNCHFFNMKGLGKKSMLSLPKTDE